MVLPVSAARYAQLLREKIIVVLWRTHYFAVNHKGDKK